MIKVVRQSWELLLSAASQGKYCSKGTICHGVKRRICIKSTLHNAVFLSRKTIAFAAVHQSITFLKSLGKKDSAYLYHHFNRIKVKGDLRYLNVFMYKSTEAKNSHATYSDKS